MVLIIKVNKKGLTKNKIPINISTRYIYGFKMHICILCRSTLRRNKILLVGEKKNKKGMAPDAQKIRVQMLFKKCIFTIAQ